MIDFKDRRQMGIAAHAGHGLGRLAKTGGGADGPAGFTAKERQIVGGHGRLKMTGSEMFGRDLMAQR